MNAPILLTLALLLALPGQSPNAQPARATPRVGVLIGALAESGPHADALREGLREHGYVEGQNIALEWRWAHGDLARLPALADELVRLTVDVIVANSNAPIRAVRQATATIPIVMVYSLNPVEVGFAASIARPGGNVTGLTLEFPELHGKRLQILKEIVPALSRVAVIWDHGLPGGEPRARDAEAAADALGLRRRSIGLRGPGELEATFATIARERGAAAYYMGSTMLYAQRARAAELAAKQRLPLQFRRVRRRRMPDHVLGELHGSVSPRRRLRRQASQGRQAGRVADPAAHQVRSRPESQDSPRDRRHDPAITPHPRGSPDRLIDVSARSPSSTPRNPAPSRST